MDHHQYYQTPHPEPGQLSRGCLLLRHRFEGITHVLCTMFQSSRCLHLCRATVLLSRLSPNKENVLQRYPWWNCEIDWPRYHVQAFILRDALYSMKTILRHTYPHPCSSKNWCRYLLHHFLYLRRKRRVLLWHQLPLLSIHWAWLQRVHEPSVE